MDIEQNTKKTLTWMDRIFTISGLKIQYRWQIYMVWQMPLAK